MSAETIEFALVERYRADTAFLVGARFGREQERERIAQAIEAQVVAGDKWWDALPDEMRGVVGAWVASSARIARQRVALSAPVECRWCPPGCPSCEPDDCECYRHQDWTDKTVDPDWPYSVIPPAETGGAR